MTVPPLTGDPNRREVVGGLAGLVVAINLPGCAAHLPPADATVWVGRAPSDAPPAELNAWVRVAPDGAVTLQMGAAEMGQGVFTSLVVILAEYLDCDWRQVRAESAPAAKEYRRDSPSFPTRVQLTGGSESVRGYWEVLAEAGTRARGKLLAAAAKRLGVDASALRTDAGYVVSGDTRIGYGELAQEAAALPPAATARRDPSEFRLIGTDVARLDVPDKTLGKAVFGTDVRVEGMLMGAVVHCPHHGGRLASFDAAAAKGSPGVVDVVQVGDDKLVCVADTFWHAKKGAEAVTASWDPGRGRGLDDAEILRRLQHALDHDTRKVYAHGNLGAPTLSATYDVPFLEHAPIEPLVATARARDGRVDVWSPNQAQQYVQANAAKCAGVGKDDVFVHTTFLGGGFGRKSFWDFTDLAVETSRKVGGRPVQVLWTREQCFARGYYRPRILCRQHARLGADGLPLDWHVEMAGQNILADFLPDFLLGLEMVEHIVLGGLVHMPYRVPNRRTDYARIELPIPVGWWRSVEASTNGFFRESFVDEMAHAGGLDPIELRRRLLAGEPRHLRVYEAALEAAGPLEAGLSRGTALFESFGSIVAEVVDVEVQGGRVLARNAGAAIDCGVAVHPANVRYQVAGALMMGISACLYEGLTFRDGAVVQSNFGDYRLLRMSEAPRVRVTVIPSTGKPGGVGECGLPPIAGALANAIFAATGKRIRTLPVGDQLVA